jgi:hypothetical protein
MLGQRLLPFPPGPTVKPLIQSICADLSKACARLTPTALEREAINAELAMSAEEKNETPACTHKCHFIPPERGLYVCPECEEMVMPGQLPPPRDMESVIDLDPPESPYGFRDY